MTGLLVEKEDLGVGGYHLIVLYKKRGAEELAPFHAMNQGDLVSLTFPPGGAVHRMDGTLYDVDEYRVSVAVNDEPPRPLPSGLYQIDILGSDATHRRMKKALATVAQAKNRRSAELRDIFFGLREPSAGESEPENLRFFNDKLNLYQKQAVRRALEAEDAALIHGPPGTGKTTVLVEIIRQTAARGGRVLASAPSNIAVDNILEKLLVSGLKVVRLGHPARTLESLRHATLSAQIAEHEEQETVQALKMHRDRLLEKYFHAGKRARHLSWDAQENLRRDEKQLLKSVQKIERSLEKKILNEADVTFVTHGGIGRQIGKGGFDLVVLDEASQATEPLSWIPILQGQKAVFAGDLMQLPPTIHSKQAAEGLGLTLFGRLQKILPQRFQSMLRIQYRMHETIMGFSSKQFYHDKLEADESVRRHTAAGLPGALETPLTRFPLAYIDTAGTGYEEEWNELLESRENSGEAKLAVKLLREIEAAGVDARDIAVLTPYLAQARLLKNLGREPGLEIGTIDSFQGREKEVVILCLVRSNDKGEVGFLGDIRRMNVAMTRARRLLVVIGDSATICRHRFYEQFVDYADGLDAHKSAWEYIET